MGIYNTVNFTAPCWACHTELTRFQTKDGDCYFGTVEVNAVRNFYTICPHCRAWNEYNVIVDTYHLERVKDADDQSPTDFPAGHI